MIRRCPAMAAVLVCSITLSGATTPTLGGDTWVTAYCEARSEHEMYWEFDVEARSSVGGYSGPIYVTGVSTDYWAGCGWFSCLDEGWLEDDEGYDTAWVFHGNNGYTEIPPLFSFSAYASSFHWTEGESFSDTTGSQNGDTDICPWETR